MARKALLPLNPAVGHLTVRYQLCTVHDRLQGNSQYIDIHEVIYLFLDNENPMIMILPSTGGLVSRQ